MLKDAIEGVVAEARSWHIPSEITTANCLEWVGPQECAEYAKSFPYLDSFLAELVSEQFRGESAKSLLDAINQDPMMAGAMLQTALREYTADHVRREADNAIEQYEPSDSDFDQYYTPASQELVEDKQRLYARVQR